MGRAKEKILARNKIKSDKKAAKIEDREQKRIEEARQAAELRLVDGRGRETDREKQKKRKKTISNHNGTVEPKRGQIVKEPSLVSPNPNHAHIPKHIWKDYQTGRGDTFFLERSQPQVGSTHDLSSATQPTLEHFLRPEEMKAVAEFFLDEAWKNSTLASIKLSEVTPAVAAVALNRFDLVKRLFKDDQYISDYSNKWVTPMGCAVIAQSWDMIEFLLEKDSEAHAVDKFGNSPLIQAALTSGWTSYDMANLWHLLKEDSRTDVRGANKVGLTLTHALAWRGWTEVLNEVLPLNSESEASCQDLWLLVNGTMCDGTTPLHLALSQGHADAAQILISRGSVIHEEDKTGSTPLCRAIGKMYFSEKSAALDMSQALSPACEVILLALNDPDCPTDIRNYVSRRLQLVMNPLLDEQGFVDAFHRVGRSVFSFLVRFVQDGLKLLLDLRFFQKLISSGKKHWQNPEYVVTIFGILFDVLVHAENIGCSYSRACLSFLTEGGPDFCLYVMRTMLECEGLETSSSSRCEASASRSAASISSTAGAGDWVTGCFGVAAPELVSHIQKNVAISALMPIVQVIDSMEMTPWFNSNFEALKSVYEVCQERSEAQMVFACDLDDQLVERTRRKVHVFEIMLARSSDSDWLSPQEVIEDFLHQLKMYNLRLSQKLPEPASPAKTVKSKLSKSVRKKKARRERAAAEIRRRREVVNASS